MLCAFALVAPRVSVAPGWSLLSGVLAFACVSAEVITAASNTPRLRSRALRWLLGPTAALAAVALAGSDVPKVVMAAVVTASLLWLGTAVGGVVGNAIEHPGHLLVVAIVSGMVDVFSVVHPSGPTAQIIELDVAVNLLLLPWPILGTSDIQPVLGVGDIVFAGIYAVASRRHGLPMWRTVLALCAGLLVTLVVVVTTHRGTPALPFLGAAFVLAHPTTWKLPAHERGKAAVGVAALAVLLGGLFYLR